jgi:hypothetical protein
MLEGRKIVSMGASVTMHMKSDHHVDIIREARFDLLSSTYNVSCHYMPQAMHREHHLLVLDVNGLLCEAIHVKFGKLWHPLVPPQRCGNKLVSLCSNSQQFLEMCNNKFDIGIWSSTILHNLKPMFDLLLRGLLGLNLSLYGVLRSV